MEYYSHGNVEKNKYSIKNKYGNKDSNKYSVKKMYGKFQLYWLGKLAPPPGRTCYTPLYGGLPSILRYGGGGTSIPEVIAAPPLILETWERYLSLIPFLLLPPPPDFRWPGPTWGEGSRPMGARVLGRQRLAR